MLPLCVPEIIDPVAIDEVRNNLKLNGIAEKAVILEEADLLVGF